MSNITNQLSQLESAAHSAYQAGNLAESKRYLLEIVDAARESPLTTAYVTQALEHLAFVHETEGDFSGAKGYYQNLLKILQEESGREHSLDNTKLTQTLRRLASVHKNLGNDRAYEQFVNRAKELEQEQETESIGAKTVSGISLTRDESTRAESSAITPDATRQELQKKELVRKDIPPLDSLVTSKERFYFGLTITIGVLACIALALYVILVPFLLLFTLISNGLFLGGIKANSMRISKRQLPELYAIIEDICSALSMEVPTVYVSNGEGRLNAFATRLLSRDFVIIYSNILEMAYEKGEAEVTFVLAHELAHIKRKHTSLMWLKMPARIVPFLSQAYSRACETTCDQIATALCPEGAKWGLVALATGSKIYRHACLDELYLQHQEEHGFWTWCHEILSTHPNLLKRIKNAGLGADTYEETEKNELKQPRHRSKSPGMA